MKSIMKLFIAIPIIAMIVFGMNTYASEDGSMTTLTGYVYSKTIINGVHTVIANAKVSLSSYTESGNSINYHAITDTTGKFKIDSVIQGEYSLHINAQGYSNFIIREFEVELNHGMNSLKFFLRDTSQMKGGIVSGKVDFENSNNAIMNSIIEFISADTSRKNFFTTTDMEGRFRTKVSVGKYYVMVSIASKDSLSFYQEYYKNAHSIADAKVITVTDGESVSDIEFEIPEQIYLPKHKITFSGTVNSTLNTSLTNARVNIWTANEGEDEHGGRFIASTRTDASGKFTVTLDSLPQSLNAFTVSASKAGYKIQFYNGKNSLYKANTLLSFADTTFSGLNFTLTPVDTVSNIYSISGNIVDTANVGIANAFVIVKDSLSGNTHVAVSGFNGNFQIKALKTGVYYLMVSATGYKSVFYSNTDEWENATAIHVTSSSITGIKITLGKSDNNVVGGHLVGEVHSENGAVLSGVLISVKNSSNVTIRTTVTGNDGSYSISGVVQGNYTLTASALLVGTKQKKTSYSPSNGSTQVNNFILPAKVTAVELSNNNSIPSKYILENNYPNPFNPSTVIKFSLPIAAHVTLTIYNILGQKVAELINNQLSAGDHTYIFNAINLSSGVYLYRLEANNFVATKKMILEK